MLFRVCKFSGYFHTREPEIPENGKKIPGNPRYSSVSKIIFYICRIILYKDLKNGLKKKNFFCHQKFPNIFEKSLFLPFLGQKFSKSPPFLPTRGILACKPYFRCCLDIVCIYVDANDIYCTQF